MHLYFVVEGSFESHVVLLCVPILCITSEYCVTDGAYELVTNWLLIASAKQNSLQSDAEFLFLMLIRSNEINHMLLSSLLGQMSIWTASRCPKQMDGSWSDGFASDLLQNKTSRWRSRIIFMGQDGSSQGQSCRF